MSDKSLPKKDEEKKEEALINEEAPVLTTEETANEYFNNWKRALADYDNLKKETARAKTEMAQFARSLVAYEFVVIYENFKKASSHFPEAGDDVAEFQKRVKSWAEGIDHIKKQFGETLKQLGLDEIKTIGEKFNPVWHEAVGEEEGKEAGIILKEIEGGYKIGDKVLKAAKVIVSK